MTILRQYSAIFFFSLFLLFQATAEDMNWHSDLDTEKVAEITVNAPSHFYDANQAIEGKLVLLVVMLMALTSFAILQEYRRKAT